MLKAYALTEKGTRREALGPHIASFHNSSTSRWLRDVRAAAELLLLVSIQLPVNSKQRIAVYLPAALKREIEKRAEEAGQTLSVWVERACRSRIRISVASSIGETNALSDEEQRRASRETGLGV
jgi:hypothetical protein